MVGTVLLLLIDWVAHSGLDEAVWPQGVRCTYRTISENVLFDGVVVRLNSEGITQQARITAGEEERAKIP
jgi:hypothetical protein